MHYQLGLPDWDKISILMYVGYILNERVRVRVRVWVVIVLGHQGVS